MDNFGGALVALGLLIAFIIYIVLPILGIIFGIALALLAVTGGAGALSGAAISIKPFFNTLQTARQKARESEPHVVFIPRFWNKHPQPAYLIYIYYQAPYIIRYMSQNVWNETSKNATTWFVWAEGWARRGYGFKWDNWSAVPKLWLKGIEMGLRLGGTFHYVAALLLTGLFIALLAAFMGLVAFVTTIIIGILAVRNWAYSRYYRIYVRCPECHEQVPIPVYVCSKCGTEHTRLWPSRYGIFAHQCNHIMPDGTVCGQHLATLDRNGRNNLTKKCPSCLHPLPADVGMMTNVHIPIVGGPLTGKSNFMVAATEQLMNKYGPEHQLSVGISDAKQQTQFDEDVQTLRAGKKLAKTSDADESARAFNIHIKTPRQTVPSLLYIYDAAGEFYQQEERTLQQVYFKYIHGLVLVIDPFSIDMVHDEYRDELKSAGARIAPSTANPENVFERMIAVLERNYKLKRNARFPHPIAVIITKVDAFNLEQKIGYSAARQLMQKNANIHFVDDAINILVEQFLMEYGASNFVNSLQNQFTHVKYFACSSLGRDPKNGYAPEGVVEPLSWLMGRVRALPTLQERAANVDLKHALQSKRMRYGWLSHAKYYIWNSLKPVEAASDS